MLKCDIILERDLYAPVAQPVEHLTFNQGVRDSSSRRSTKQKDHPKRWSFCLAPCVSKSRRSKSEGFATLRSLSPSESL